MVWLYGGVSFLSAFLLFWTQPLAARGVLPALGGAPAVWNTCMVFFQVLLLAGYAYAHWLAARRSFGAQVLVHLVVLAVALLFPGPGLRPTAAGGLTPEGMPVAWLLVTLVTSLALPFFALSANAPLLQRWFGRSGHARAADPFFLYAASNAGSLGALLAFPFLLEPGWTLGAQAEGWRAGYLTLVALAAACALVTARRGGLRAEEVAVSGDSGVVRGRKLRWILWSFVPSSWMLGVTTYLTTDVGSVPFFWIVPLGIYLVTFVAVFARRGAGWQAGWERLLPMGAVMLAFAMLSRSTQPAWALISLHLGVLGIAAMTCHGWLAGDRPDAGRLTTFYLCLSAGGALGGMFNALVAPWLFGSAAEYPLAVLAAIALWAGRTGWQGATRQRVLDVGLPVLLGVLTACLVVSAPVILGSSGFLSRVLSYGVPLVLCFLLVDRRVRFALGLALVMLAGTWLLGPYGRLLHQERNFFGITRVTEGPRGTFRHLVHGNTLHGRQFRDPQRQCEPLAYYHRTGPLGDIIEWFRSDTAFHSVAAVGLGAGAAASYSRPGERWTFFEIDPAVIRVARDSDLFTYLGHCAQGEIAVVVGDARVQLQRQPPGGFGLILLDAFSSDAIPVHLLTREAVEMYLERLEPGGMLAFHISNRYLDLEPVVAAVAASLGAVCRSCDDANLTPAEALDGKEESHWMVVARREEDLGKLGRSSRWLPVAAGSDRRVWTDDYSDVLSVFKWW